MSVKISNKALSEWYLLLSQQIEAGVTLSQAVQLSGVLSPTNRHDIVNALDGGMDTVEVFERFAPWMPTTDRALIAAANAAGKLPETLANLASRRASMSENISRAIGATIYPIFIVHLAAFVTPIFQLIDMTHGNLTFHPEAYFRYVGASLGVAWTLIIIAAILLRQNNPKVMGFFPVLRHYSVLQAYSDFAGMLGAFLKAGTTHETAWHAAGEASRDDRLKELGRNIGNAARNGVRPSTLLNPKGPLPAEFVSLYVSGEQTGQLEKNLDLLTTLFQEKANQKLQAASKFYPIVIFLAVAVYVGWGIVNFYMSYLDILMNIMKG
jgi:general secretion pathway protein F/type IV pilus assembly protein PilC